MGGFSVLNNIPALAAQNSLNITNAQLQRTLFRLSSGSRISRADEDAAGLAIADGLKANITALQQSIRNLNNGIGRLQVADGALSQVTTMLNRALTLATQASNSDVSSAQRDTLNSEFTEIKNEIDRIGSRTQFNGATVFSSTPFSAYISDGTSTGSNTISVTIGTLSASGLGLTSSIVLSGSDGTNAQSAVTAINSAISTVANTRGAIGAAMNRLQSAANVLATQVQNVTAAEDMIRAADIAEEISNLTRFSVLSQTGVAAVAQANARLQNVLALLR